MSTEVIIALLGIASTAIGSWTSWFFTRKKYSAEVDNDVIDNMKQSLDFYIKLSDDNKERLDEALKRNAQLEDEVAQLRNQVFDLMHSICSDLTCKYRRTVTEKAKSGKSKKNDKPAETKK